MRKDENLSVFQICRGIPAVEVARREGIEVIRRGTREWARCPFHPDREPSLRFTENGGWWCFGCHQGGDAVSFLSRLKQIPPLQAARQILGLGIEMQMPTARQREESKAEEDDKRVLKAELAGWHARAWNAACDAKNAAAEVIEERERALEQDGKTWEAAWEDGAFVAAARLHAAAHNRIYALDSPDLKDPPGLGLRSRPEA